MSDRPSRHAHKLVVETAVNMAHELYSFMMQDNSWYQLWKYTHPDLGGKELEERFVTENLARLMPQARAVLAGMLRTSTDESQKELIYDALVLDATLVRGRGH